MEESKRNHLEAKLKEMLKNLDEAEAKQKQPLPKPVNGNIIRRRKGQKEKRFSVENPS